ncbi:hypothetical protein ACE02S_19775 [Shewanella xiamenensis]
MKQTLLFAAISLAIATPSLAHNHLVSDQHAAIPSTLAPIASPSAPLNFDVNHRPLLPSNSLIASPNEPTHSEYLDAHS